MNSSHDSWYCRKNTSLQIPYKRLSLILRPLQVLMRRLTLRRTRVLPRRLDASDEGLERARLLRLVPPLRIGHLLFKRELGLLKQ